MSTLRQAALCIAFILSGPSCDAAGEQVVKVMDSIVIPSVSFEKVPLEEAVDWARFKSVEFDPSPAPYKGVGIIICHQQKNKKPDTDTGGLGDTPTAELGRRTITYTAKKVTLTTLLIEIAKQAELDLHITTVAIVFCSPGQQPFPNDKAENDKIVRTLYKVRPTVPAKPIPTPKANKTSLLTPDPPPVPAVTPTRYFSLRLSKLDGGMALVGLVAGEGIGLEMPRCAFLGCRAYFPPLTGERWLCLCSIGVKAAPDCAGAGDLRGVFTGRS